MRIRTKLMALLVAVAAAPVALAGLVAYRAARNALATAIAESHARAAQAEAEITAGYLDPIVAELTGALLHEDPAALRPAEVSEYLTRVFLRRNRIAIAALLDERRAVAATVFVDDPEVFARSEPQFRLHDTVAAAEAEAFQKVAIDLAARISPDRAYAVSDPYQIGRASW